MRTKEHNQKIADAKKKYHNDNKKIIELFEVLKTLHKYGNNSAIITTLDNFFKE